MNIIELVKKVITDCPLMTEFTSGIDVDFTSNTIGTFGMYSNGDALESSDIMGGEIRRHSFVLYACNQPISNYQRLENTDFLLKLGYYLDKQKGQNITEEVAPTTQGGQTTTRTIGTLKSLSCSNAMLYDVPTGDIKDGVRYQLQIQAKYYLNP